MYYIVIFFISNDIKQVTCIKAKKNEFHTLHNIKVQVENHFIRLTQEYIFYQNHQIKNQNFKNAARSKTLE